MKPPPPPTRFSRRRALLGTLFGAGGVGLRALATGLPASLFLNPRRALAATPSAPMSCAARSQYVIFNTSGDGDSINASAPGTYDDPMIVHCPAPELGPRPLMMRGRTFTAGAPWATLPTDVLDRTVFFHLMTNTPVHSKEPEVLRLMGATPDREMFPTLLAQQLAPCLDTIQPQPICVGALTPSEALSLKGAALPVIPPLALRATLANAAGPLSALQPLRDATLARLYDVYQAAAATPAQKRYLDAMVLSQRQVRSIQQDLLDALARIQDNGPESQVLAAVTLIRMNVSPVVTVHIPFGGDNHRDVGLVVEGAQTVAGVATIASLMQQLGQAGLADQVSFLSLNVFGRTLGAESLIGRQHNEYHQVSLAIGKPFAGGVVGAVQPVARDFGATAIDSTTGVGVDGADIQPIDTLAAFAQTALAGVGGDPTVITSPSGTARVVKAALA